METNGTLERVRRSRVCDFCKDFNFYLAIFSNCFFSQDAVVRSVCCIQLQVAVLLADRASSLVYEGEVIQISVDRTSRMSYTASQLDLLLLEISSSRLHLGSLLRKSVSYLEPRSSLGPRTGININVLEISVLPSSTRHDETTCRNAYFPFRLHMEDSPDSSE